ncbi:hypothetical protein BJ138DRAFT_1175416 [Hygrophoropsis aurantiaca]|uniref:Uncharacterized protein n=1 Tax=Hygrophoropsis aurantiaca TaxID=72124 RepID=A0ACB7ZSH2_9AGAM|nr:hypothetical protein BJ138DRAFT_1175416 [Hygrophoropsis aurantiaca]
MRDTFVAEFLRLEGRGDYGSLKCRCGNSDTEYRCRDCHGQDMFCKSCILQAHAAHPLHRLEKWNGIFFSRAKLKDLGLRIQLGHRLGGICPNPSPAFNNDFIVLDVNGVHEVSLDYCGCDVAAPVVIQLLRIFWYPATTVDPKTGATFRLLEHYHLLSFESKASAFEYYNALVRLTDNTGVYVTKDRYESLLQMVREWRHVKQLKRAGRGHELEGPTSSGSASCAVTCPACPQPGINLPVGWDEAPPECQFLYALFLGIDANFRLARRNVSSEAADPSLNDGSMFFVSERPYKDLLSSYKGPPQDKSSCNSHNAVNMADTKASRGLAATGAGTIDCARHNFKRPNSVGDLQKGERYVNIDYLFFSSMQQSPGIKTLFISYDIACQWNKNLWARMLWFPQQMQIDQTTKSITFLVPKFHLPAHVAPCQTAYSFNFTKGVGRTDGEAPERGWANINPVATSTKEMGPGSRRDTLDDHFNDWNWKKMCTMGVSLYRKLNNAIPQSEKHAQEFSLLSALIPPESLTIWTTEVERWESDNNNPNPFQSSVSKLSQPAVRLALSQAEALEMEQGTSLSLHDTISPSVLISSGIELEDQQRILLSDLKNVGLHATDNQKANLQLRVNTLRRKIENWSRAQLLYMPMVAHLRMVDDTANSQEEKVYEIKLWLPSQLPDNITCDHRLLEYEWKLRLAQAYDSLNDLRHNLRMTTCLFKFKDKNIRGQRPNTRARTIITNTEARTHFAAAKYKAARQRLVRLAQRIPCSDEWTVELKELDTSRDLRKLGEGHEGESEGNRTLSWIWKTHDVADTTDRGIADALRIEWNKARARAHRWQEEIQLLKEEMRRVLAFFGWQADWWDRQASRRTDVSAAHAEGLQAYAARQAWIRRNMANHFVKLWSGHCVVQ